MFQTSPQCPQSCGKGPNFTNRRTPSPVRWWLDMILDWPFRSTSIETSSHALARESQYERIPYSSLLDIVYCVRHTMSGMPTISRALAQREDVARRQAHAPSTKDPKHVHQRSMAWRWIVAAQQEGLILSSALLQLSREFLESKTDIL
jgi:hypothetical protein